jgi:hypothetical protein
MKRLLSLLLSPVRSETPKFSHRSPRRKPRRQFASRRLHLEELETRSLLTPVAAPSGLVSWWTANGTTADAMGLNNATLTGVTYATGEVGQAFSFDGVDDSAKVADSNSLAITASITIEGWIKVNAFPSSGSQQRLGLNHVPRGQPGRLRPVSAQR